MKALKSKTLNFAAVLAIFGAAQANLSLLQEVISPPMYGWLTFGFAVVVALLRVLTTKPLSEK